MPGKPLKKRTLSGNGRGALAGLADIPPKHTCPMHGHAMAFKVEKNYWACPTPGCKIVSYPENDPGKRPIEATGKLQVIVQRMKDGSAEVYLRSENNVVMEITPLILADSAVTHRNHPNDPMQSHVEFKIRIENFIVLDPES